MRRILLAGILTGILMTIVPQPAHAQKCGPWAEFDLRHGRHVMGSLKVQYNGAFNLTTTPVQGCTLIGVYAKIKPDGGQQLRHRFFDWGGTSSHSFQVPFSELGVPWEPDLGVNTRMWVMVRCGWKLHIARSNPTPARIGYGDTEGGLSWFWSKVGPWIRFLIPPRVIC